jgi:hypothetical protein
MSKPAKTIKDPSKRPKNTDINTIKRQLKQNPLLSQRDLAAKNGITCAAVNRLLKRHGINQGDVEDYKKVRADLFAGKQEIILRNISEPTIKRMIDKHPMAATTLFNSLFNNERLERGKDTGSINLHMQFVLAANDDLKGTTIEVKGERLGVSLGVSEDNNDTGIEE